MADYFPFFYGSRQLAYYHHFYKTGSYTKTCVSFILIILAIGFTHTGKVNFGLKIQVSMSFR